MDDFANIEDYGEISDNKVNEIHDKPYCRFARFVIRVRNHHNGKKVQCIYGTGNVFAENIINMMVLNMIGI